MSVKEVRTRAHFCVYLMKVKRKQFKKAADNKERFGLPACKMLIKKKHV